MTSLNSSFESLDKYIRLALNNEEFSVAKEFLSGWVNSNRQMENIKTIDELLKLLKRRGIYKSQHFNALRVFKKVIHDSAFHDMVDKHLLLQQESEDGKRNLFGNIACTINCRMDGHLNKKTF